MKFFHELSCPTTLPELDIFAVPATQLGWIGNRLTQERPQAILDSEKNITFDFVTAPDEYVRLNKTTLHLNLRVDLSRTDDKTVTSLDWLKISTVNNFAHSLFKHVEIAINGVNIVKSPSHYSYKAYYESFFGFTDDAKKSYMSTAMFENEKKIEKSSVSTFRRERIAPLKPLSADTPNNPGQGKEIRLVFKLHLDLALQPRAIIGGNRITITLQPNSPQFYLMKLEENIMPKVVFTDCYLQVFRGLVSPNVLSAHAAGLQKAPAKFPISRLEIKQWILNPGPTVHQIDNVVNGVMPRTLFIAFVNHQAFNGDYRKNPYYFDHLNVIHIAAFADGQQFPRVAYTPNFSSDLYDREFYALHDILDQTSTDATCTLTRDKFANGMTIYAFEFEPESLGALQRSLAVVNPVSYGNIRLEIKLEKSLEETFTALTFCEFDSLIEISGAGEVATNYF